jgi:hypothetical protein
MGSPPVCDVLSSMTPNAAGYLGNRKDLKCVGRCDPARTCAAIAGQVPLLGLPNLRTQQSRSVDPSEACEFITRFDKAVDLYSN